ncbi:MAG: AMP-binding protein [Rhodoferax sp.]
MQVPTHLTIAAIVREWARCDPDRPALIFEGADIRPDVIRTYGDLWRNAQAFAQGFRQNGIGTGDVIATLMANHAEFVELMVACAISGSVLVPIDPRTRGEKLRFMLHNSGAIALVAADYALPQVLDTLSELEGLRWIAALPTDEGMARSEWPDSILETSTLMLRTPEELPVEGVDPDSAMEILFTSGTTGDPKGIVMTHRRYCETSLLARGLFGYTDQDRLYSGLSLTHANAQLVTLGAALCAGLLAVFSRRFTKTRLWDITRRYQCTTFTLLGGMTTAVYAEPMKPDDADNPVRFVVSAGMPAAIWKEFESRFNVHVVEFYGSAEGGLSVKPANAGPAGSIGKVAPAFIHRIINEDGSDATIGMSGELLFRYRDGRPFVVEYVGNTEASAMKCKDGWLWMGDIVHQDAQGWLFFDFRKGGGIRRNGDFVNTAFVEKAIAESGLIDDVYVYGVKGVSGAPGEKDVVAAVVPLDAASFDPQKLFAICRAKLEANFVPSYVQVLAQIPKTASEKPQDRFLIEAFGNNPEQVHTERKSA